MLEFLIGYTLGASASDRRRLSVRGVLVTTLVLTAVAGIGWLLIAVLLSPSSAQECRGVPVAATMCSIENLAMGAAATLLAIALAGAAAFGISASLSRTE